MIKALVFSTLAACEAAIERLNANGRGLLMAAGYELDEEGRLIGKNLASGASDPEAQLTFSWDVPHAHTGASYWVRDPRPFYAPEHEPAIMAGLSGFTVADIEPAGE